MPRKRALGLAFLVLFGLSLVGGRVGATTLYLAMVVSLACAAHLFVLVRRGRRPLSGLPFAAAFFAALFSGGGIYVINFSPPTDIGGGLPFLVGIVGMVIVAVLMIAQASDDAGPA